MACVGCKNAPRWSRKLGWWKYLRSIYGKKVDPQIAEIRLALCRACMEQERDVTGRRNRRRIFRVLNDVPYCGAPRKFFERRDDSQVGCGCRLTEKVKYREASCPLGRWGPREYLGPNILVTYESSKRVDRLQDVIDVHVRSKYKPNDCNGLGDLIMASMIAKGVQAQDRTKRVRIMVIEKNYQWARLFWPRESIAMEGTRDIGEEEIWLVKNGWFEHDRNAIKEGTNRITQWAKAAGGVSPQPLTVIHDPDSLLWAQNELPLADDVKIACMFPYAHSLQRSWPYSRWIQLAEALIAQGYYVYTLDGPEGKERTRAIPGMRYWGIPSNRVAALLKYTNIVFSNDSGGAHLAGIMGIPTIAVCAPTIGKLVFDHVPSVHPLQAEGPCTGCTYSLERGWKLSCVPACELMWFTDVLRVLNKAKEVQHG